MIDVFNALWRELKQAVQTEYPDLKIFPASTQSPAAFPCLTVEEYGNVPVHLDNGDEMFSRISWRVQVFSNKQSGRRQEANAILNLVDQWLYAHNFTRRSRTEKPELYSSTICQMTATYDAEVDVNGYLYRT